MPCTSNEARVPSSASRLPRKLPLDLPRASNVSSLKTQGVTSSTLVELQDRGATHVHVLHSSPNRLPHKL
ncbi:hypothetical protein VTO73DRAFT_14117 [Trametes versicolor]